MSDFCCEVCKKTPNEDRIALFRTGQKGPGQDPRWRCAEHLHTPVDETVKKITDALTIIPHS